MAMADVAFAAGFASVRQFNDTVREVYGVPPTTLARRGRAGAALPAAAGAIVLRLPYRPPFDAAGLLAFFAARAVAGSWRSAGGRRLRRDAAAPARRRRRSSSRSLATARHQRGREARATRTSPPRCGWPIRATSAPAVARLRRLLDLDADPVAVDELLGADPALARAVAAVPGIRLPGTVDGAETALRALLGQQVSVAAARTAAARLADALGERLPPALAATGPDLLFPTAATDRRARRGGADRARPADREHRARLAAALADGTLALDAGRDPADLRADLVALPGDRAVDRGLPGDARARRPRRTAARRPRPSAAAPPPSACRPTSPRPRAPRLGPVAFLRRPAPLGRRYPDRRPHEHVLRTPRHPDRPVHRRRRRRRRGARLRLDRRARRPPPAHPPDAAAASSCGRGRPRRRSATRSSPTTAATSAPSTTCRCASAPGRSSSTRGRSCARCPRARR